MRSRVPQACRLWHADISTCEVLLEQLVREGFLYKTDTGGYIRVRNLVEQIEHADQVGLDVFGIGEHHRRDLALDELKRSFG